MTPDDKRETSTLEVPDTETGAPMAPTGDDAGTPSDLAVTRLGVPRLVALTLALLLVGAVTLAAVLWHHDHVLQGQVDTERTVATTASDLGEALLSYNAADLSRSRARVLALSTAAFAQTYNKDFTQSLGSTITALKATSTAAVRDVYVADISGGNAKAIVVVDFQTKSQAGTRRVVGTNLRMDLIDQAGHWKVNDVTVISATSQTQTSAAKP